MSKKVVKKKISKKAKSRLFLAFVIFGSIISGLSYKFFYNINQIHNMLNEKNTLEDKLVALEDEEKTLESDILKLEDPVYIAKYAREKYLYSKDGEFIFKIQEDN